MRLRWLILPLLLVTRASEAADYPADPSDYRDILPTLVAGDRILLAAGEYPGLPVYDMDGASGNPITITGPETGPPAIIVGRSGQNTISIRDASYVIIRYLDVDVRGFAVDGLKAESNGTSAHHITIEYVNMFNFGADQQVVGISTKTPAWDWTIRYNTIYGAGTGLYLGNSPGDHPFIRGDIAYNLVVNPIGYCMQIKQQNTRPDLPGIPGDGSVTLIRHNVFIKAANASFGNEARPNLLVGSFPETGPGQTDRYEIYGNFLYENQSQTEALFQGEGKIAFHDNILVNTFGAGMYIQNQFRQPEEIAIYHNTIYASSEGIGIFDPNPGFNQRIIANAIFADTPMQGGDQVENFTETFANAATYVTDPSNQLGTMDFYPLSGGLQDVAVDLSAYALHVDMDRDFNGEIRSGTFRGAYAGDGANPGWQLDEAIKGDVPTSPPPDAGVVDTGNPQPDGGGPLPDTGAPVVDTGVPQPDGGMNPGPDTGSTGPDNPGGEDPDAIGGGCGCEGVESPSANSPWSALAIGLLTLALIRRRKQ